MTTAERLCARCHKQLPVRPTGRPSRYCSTACRVAGYRARRDEEVPNALFDTPVTNLAPAASSRRGLYRGPLCPTDPTHGRLIDWPGSERWGWYCPHQAHDGWGETPRTRAFFTTVEVDRGSIEDPAPRSAPVIPTVLPPSGATEETAESDQALTRAPSVGEVLARHVNDVIAASNPAARPPDPDPRVAQDRGSSARPGLRPTPDPTSLTLGLAER